VTLTVTNTSSIKQGVVARYPFFGEPTKPGIVIEGEAGSARRLISSSLGGGRAPIIDLEPGEKWSVGIPLQAFLPDPTAGVHRLTYAIDIPCVTADHFPNGHSAGNGTISIVVLEGGDQQVRDVIAECARRARFTDGADEFWTVRAAQEELATTPSPLVIPFLRDFLDSPLTNSVVLGLAKFKGNTEAESLVDDVIRGNSHVEAAITVLTQWDRRIPVAEFELLLSRENSNLTVALMRYATAVNGRDYLPAVERMSQSSNELIAHAASAAKSKLGAR
jgi:hypothetical protein